MMPINKDKEKKSKKRSRSGNLTREPKDDSDDASLSAPSTSSGSASHARKIKETKKLNRKREGKRKKKKRSTSSSSSSSSSFSSSSSSNSSNQSTGRLFNSLSGEMEKPLTAAEILRRHMLQKDNHKQGDNKIATSTSTKQEDDIDDQIRRLEAELQDDDESDSSSDYVDDAEHDNPSPAAAKILSLSDSRMARIEGLPAAYLPAPAPATRKRASKGSNLTDEKGSLKEKETTSLVSEGLKAAVQEVLNGYKPRSSERIPFYCRCCVKQYENADSFFQHKETDFHKAAEIMERKASYCKLCRKQMTSPAQLKEHLKSRPHKDRLQQMKSRQPQNRNDRNTSKPTLCRRIEVPSRGRRHGPSI
jgi:hypothetical protein